MLRHFYLSKNLKSSQPIVVRLCFTYPYSPPLSLSLQLRYLPVKTELVICCPLTEVQLHLYNAFARQTSKQVDEAERKKKPQQKKGGGGLGVKGLAAITQMKKVFVVDFKAP